MCLFRAEICVEILTESGIGKTLKYFIDYCRLYEEDLPELKNLANMSEQIFQKWKNFVLNTIFDDKRENKEEF